MQHVRLPCHLLKTAASYGLNPVLHKLTDLLPAAAVMTEVRSCHWCCCMVLVWAWYHTCGSCSTWQPQVSGLKQSPHSTWTTGLLLSVWCRLGQGAGDNPWSVCYARMKLDVHTNSLL